MDSTLKSLEFGKDSRDHLLEGVKTLCDAVRVTLGPRGNNVVIEQHGGPPLVTKDGVTVARSINLRDKFANLGAQIVKEAASRACDVAGDGTTTATVLTHSIFSEGQRLMSAGFPSLDLRRGIEDSVDLVTQELREMSRSVTGPEEIESVGTISANGEREIGRLLVQAMGLVGNSGIITVEEAKGFATSLHVTEGAEIDRGYISPYFVTDQDKMVCEMKDPFVLVTNKKISTMREIVPLLEKCLSESKPLLIVADDVEGEALQGLVMNKAKGILSVCVVRAPEFGDSRVPALEDLATLLGCELFIGGDGELTKLGTESLGRCSRIEVNRNKTLFIQPAGDKVRIEERVESLREQLKSPLTDEYTAQVINRRLSRLAGSVAVIRVGGATELEVKERKDRVDDALHATRAAVESGILPGGGTSLVQASKSLKRLERGTTDGYRAGVGIVRKACTAPLRQILENAGVPHEKIIDRAVKETRGVGFDASKLEWCNMYDRGIIDPAKVVISSLEHATSAGLLLLSVGASIVDDPSEGAS